MKYGTSRIRICSISLIGCAAATASPQTRYRVGEGRLALSNRARSLSSSTVGRTPPAKAVQMSCSLAAVGPCPMPPLPPGTRPTSGTRCPVSILTACPPDRRHAARSFRPCNTRLLFPDPYLFGFGKTVSKTRSNVKSSRPPNSRNQRATKVRGAGFAVPDSVQRLKSSACRVITSYHSRP